MSGFDEAERVRRRLAHRLHDGPIQELTAAQLFLDGAIMRLDDGRPEDLGDALDKGVQALRRATAACRSLMEQLGPGVEAEGELEMRLRRLAGEVDPAAPVEVRVPADFGHDHAGVALALYRVAEELLDNVRRHAAGRLDRLTLSVRGDDVRLEVADRGPGLPDEAGQRSGLALAEAQLGRLGGELELRSDSSGTRASASLRLP